MREFPFAKHFSGISPNELGSGRHKCDPYVYPYYLVKQHHRVLVGGRLPRGRDQLVPTHKDYFFKEHHLVLYGVFLEIAIHTVGGQIVLLQLIE